MAFDKAEATPNPMDLYVGTRIRLCRKLRRITQTRLATGIGVTFKQVQKYELGRTA